MRQGRRIIMTATMRTTTAPTGRETTNRFFILSWVHHGIIIIIITIVDSNNNNINDNYERGHKGHDGHGMSLTSIPKWQERSVNTLHKNKWKKETRVICDRVTRTWCEQVVVIDASLHILVPPEEWASVCVFVCNILGSTMSSVALLFFFFATSMCNPADFFVVVRHSCWFCAEWWMTRLKSKDNTILCAKHLV